MVQVLTTGTGLMANLGLTLTGILASPTTPEVAKIGCTSACKPGELGMMSTKGGVAPQSTRCLQYLLPKRRQTSRATSNSSRLVSTMRYGTTRDLVHNKTCRSGGRASCRCHLIGMTAKNGHSPPNFSTLVIRAGGSDIAPPERFDQHGGRNAVNVASGAGAPSRHRGTFHLATWGQSARPPSRKDMVCVALGCLSPNRQPLGGEIWNDRGGGAPRDAAFFEQPGGTGLFRCSDDATHNKPHGEFPLPGQASIGLPRTQPLRPQPLDEAATESNKRPAIIAFVIGIIMFGIGLPLFIGGHSPAGEQNLGMIVPGAIMFGVGILGIGRFFYLISSWAKSYAETGKPAPRWTWMGWCSPYCS